MKKLIVLAGNKKLRSKFTDVIVDLKAAQPVSLRKEPTELLAKLAGKDASAFLDAKKSAAPFEQPFLLDSKVVGRYAAQLGRRILPVTVAGSRYETPAALAKFMVDEVPAQYWGKNWLVEHFLDSFVHEKDGVFLLTDADGFEKELVDRLPQGQVEVVGLRLVQEDGSFLESDFTSLVTSVVEHGVKNQQYKTATVKLLEQLKEKFKNS